MDDKTSWLHSTLQAQGNHFSQDEAASTQQACNEIKNELPGLTVFPHQADYKVELKRYWSSALQDLKPACIVSPKTTAQVSMAMRILNKYPLVKFAVRSGGHDPNPGHASTHGGVLICLHRMKGATYDAKTALALVKPGGVWNDVITDLEKYGVTIVGGRLGSNPSQSFTK